MAEDGFEVETIASTLKLGTSAVRNRLVAAGIPIETAERARLQRLARELEKNPPPPLYVPDYARTGEDLLAEARANQESEAYTAWLNEPEPADLPYGSWPRRY
jgi:hypothetical protein